MNANVSNFVLAGQLSSDMQWVCHAIELYGGVNFRGLKPPLVPKATTVHTVILQELPELSSVG